jgi:hypothetical protein
MNKVFNAMLLLLCTPLSAWTQNPIIRDQFTADPTARVFDGRVYLYPSHDIFPPDAFERKDWFCMADYHVFSSDNLTQWTDHGTILSQQDVPWGKPDAYSMWAPDCVKKGGRYYFYFPNVPMSGRGFAIGVATSDSPTGPFVPEQQAIKGVGGIDPCVLIDNDGQAYLYWSGMGIRGARLKDNMTELDGEQKVMEGLPEGFKEGPFVFRRGDWYYLTFPWVRGDTSNGKNPTETLSYAMSRSPLGPWDFKGIIMAEHDNRCWTNHHSILEYQGKWYLFYHRNHLSPNDDKRRSACIEEIAFRPDGTIQEVFQTMRGVGVNRATERIEVDRYSQASRTTHTALIDSTNGLKGFYAALSQKGTWLRYAQVDFSGVDDGYAIVSVRANNNTECVLREKSAKGKVIARISVEVKGGQGFRRDRSGQWLTLTAPIKSIPKGVADLVVTCEGEPFDIDWVQFKNHPQHFSPVPKGAEPSHPDEDGFIRRWMLLEPISQDMGMNNVFTYSYMREFFSKPFFKDQMTIVPHDGEKVKVGKQMLAWHALDSKTYNARLFHFASRWGQQTYRSLFWVVTVIDCPEEKADVRLAVGTNGASMWWLNGEEVLMLESDRRMVQDDGVSPRLTLHQGRNILRGAVINGPGLSDMCVRFLDHEGKPVRDINIIGN